MPDGYDQYKAYFGDIHNHCAIGYGHGSIEEAFQNARMQLDFACVTVHAHWPDIPEDEERLASVVAYHRKGFERTRKGWSHLREVVEANQEDDRFVTFLGFEWHSRQYGDHTIYFKGSEGEVIRAANLEELRQALRFYRQNGIDTLLLPHHIGYRQGYRGINWETYTEELSPIVEIMSMHGASEGPEAPYPYLHTMGPRDWRSTYQYGLAQGNICGVMGSTDQHSGHPGSYGHGRMAVWATDLSREAVWDAIKARRTVALSGDNIKVAFAINGEPIGSVLEAAAERHLEVAVEGGGAIDYVEVVRNNRIFERANGYEQFDSERIDPFSQPLRVHLEVGWGEKGVDVEWQVELEVVGGKLVNVEPRFRGHELVEPHAGAERRYAFSRWTQGGDGGVEFTTLTWGNDTSTTASTQGLCLQVQGNANTVIRARINGQDVAVQLADLVKGPYAGYLGGFLTPAYCFHRAAPRAETMCCMDVTDRCESMGRDWYYVRVRQSNGQWAWSSPIWVEGQV